MVSDIRKSDLKLDYQPYRDEDISDFDDTNTWSDNEQSSVQIYEKTTEEIPLVYCQKRMSWAQIALFVTCCFIGFLFGYIVHNVHTPKNELSGAICEAMKSYELEEDATIREKLASQISGHRILSLLQKYDGTNRMPGSDDDHEFANHVKNSFLSYGFDSVTTTNFTFKTMLPRTSSVVQLLDRNDKLLYSNIETELYQHDDMRPFLPLSQAEALSITTNRVVYVNKGTKEDYFMLVSLGVRNISDSVFVIRQTFYQAHDIIINAQENGARAILLFPDPDTYGSTSPFPRSVQLKNDAGRSYPTAWSNYGDLASFNTTTMSGIDISKLGLDKETKVHIPLIPISYDSAKVILRGLTGPQSPSDWNCFDFTLYIGPGYRDEYTEDKRSKLKIEFDNKETSITSAIVTGTIAGSTESDRYIVIGSRRDSLNRGLLDSVSGTAVMLEIANTFGKLVKEGWRPRRTLVFNSFGAESLNLIGSSHWLEEHQRILHSRAIAYLNCDLVITGNSSATVTASPLLFQVLYNATKQVSNPNFQAEPNLSSVYDAWLDSHSNIMWNNVDSDKFMDPDLEKLLDETIQSNSKVFTQTDGEDALGEPGTMLSEYKNSTNVIFRPIVRRLDLQSMYSPFFLYAGIPIIDVRYSRFNSHHNGSNLLEEMIPIIGTKYDNQAAIHAIDPHLKYHVAVAQTMTEIVRDLSDSVFLPFNLLEYAVILRDSYKHFVARHGHFFNKTSVDLEPLKQAIIEFTKAAIKFHHRQDMVKIGDLLKVRKLNDQLMQLERVFFDSNGMANLWERKHIILSPNDGQEHREGFPGLVDWITMLENEQIEPEHQSIFADLLKVHYNVVIQTITKAIKVIDVDHIL